MELADIVAVITGGASGIGRETSLLFAAEGAAVVVADVADAGAQETVTMIESAGGRAISLHADVSQAADCERMVAAAEETYGRLDILFNNAGIMHPDDGDASETTEEIWDLTMAVNLKGTYLCTRVVAKYLIDRGRGGKISWAGLP